MPSLTIQINWITKTATFSGPGTFQAKDDIKRLGAARWNGTAKVWEVRGFSKTAPELEALFGDVEIVEEGESTPQALETPGVPRSLSVAEVLGSIDAALRKAFPAAVFVRGVLSKVNNRRGSLFIELRDEDADDRSLDVVVWSNNATLIEKKLKDAGFALEEDLNILLQGEVRMHSKRSSVSFVVFDVVPEYTIGKLARQREITNEKLKKEGLFEKQKQLVLPMLPLQLGVITSTGGTVINDFKASLDEGGFGYELLWFHASVQGASASKEIRAGIKALVERGVDAILIFRGGGSRADLAVFNEYELAKSICNCPLPVISAVGHQADESSTQDVSFRAFGVPKDVGRFFADIVTELRTEFAAYIENLRRGAEALTKNSSVYLSRQAQLVFHLSQALVSGRRDSLVGTTSGIPRLSTMRLREEQKSLFRVLGPAPKLANLLIRSVQEQLTRESRQLLSSSVRVAEKSSERMQGLRYLSSLLSRRLESAETKLDGLERLVKEQSPEQQLKRGFSVVRDKDKRIVHDAEALPPGTRAELEFYRGTRIVDVVE